MSFQHSPLEVDHDPSSDLGTNFSALDARATREAEEKKKQVETPQVTKYLQDRLLKTTSWYAVWLYVDKIKPGDIINFWWRCARRKKLWRSFSLPWWAKPENFAIWSVTWRRATVILLQQRTLTINSGNTLHYPGVLHLSTLQAIPVQTPTSVLASGPCSSLAFPRCLKTLEMHIADVDKHYDGCNESWARGEVEDFGTEEYLGWLK